MAGVWAFAIVQWKHVPSHDDSFQAIKLSAARRTDQCLGDPIDHVLPVVALLAILLVLMNCGMDTIVDNYRGHHRGQLYRGHHPGQL